MMRISYLNIYYFAFLSDPTLPVSPQPVQLHNRLPSYEGRALSPHLQNGGVRHYNQVGHERKQTKINIKAFQHVSFSCLSSVI